MKKKQREEMKEAINNSKKSIAGSYLLRFVDKDMTPLKAFKLMLETFSATLEKEDKVGLSFFLKMSSEAVLYEPDLSSDSSLLRQVSKLLPGIKKQAINENDS